MQPKFQHGIFDPMPDRNRLSKLAARGWLVAILLLGHTSFGKSQDAPIEQPKAAVTQAEQTQPEPTPFAASERTEAEPKPEHYQAACDQPRDGDEADLCEQRRMADAAENQLAWIEAQFYATIAEIVFLLAAVGAAVWAAWAATDAVSVAKETSRHQLRAYVNIDSVHVASIAPNRWSVEVKFKNFGQTPANSMNNRMETGVYPFPTADLDFIAVEVPTGTIPFAPGHDVSTIVEVEISPDIQRLMAEGKQAFYVHGLIKYIDVFKVPRETRYRLYVGGDAGFPAGFRAAVEGNEAT